MTGLEGYTLYAPMDLVTTFLIDNYGRIINTWESQYRPNLGVYLLENGNLARTILTSDGNYGVEIMTWDGEVVWEFFYTDEMYYQHHDIEPLPNGNILFLVRDIRTSSELVDAGRDPASISTARLWLEKIVEIQPTGLNTGTIIWEWSLYDHLIQDYDPEKNNYGVVADHNELMNVNYTLDTEREWLHANSIDYNSQLDQIIFNPRNIGEFWIIDHSTSTSEASSHTGGNSDKGGDILYRWGNPENYNAGSTSDKRFYLQHDARWVEEGFPGEGNITVFNNGEDRPDGNYSTVDEITPDIDQNGNYIIPLPGNPFGPADQTWVYKAFPQTSMYSSQISGAHRLQNGNTIICEGISGHLFEVTPSSSIVWEYIAPFNFGEPDAQGQDPSDNRLFRCHRHRSDYPAFDGRDMKPQGYIEISPIIVEGTYHTPEFPTELDEVIITSKIFDDSGIASATLHAYYGSDSLIVTMNDSATGADLVANDSIYTAAIPALIGVDKVNYLIKIADGSADTFTDPPFGSIDYTFSYNPTSAIPVNILISNDESNLTLHWDPVPGISTYKVYSSDKPYNDFIEDTSGVFQDQSWTTISSNSKKFYYVVAVK
ncbi:MAG: aryl-sulfate sulfotransferase [Candidatus Delongbacteria bacterium]|nr:aryl-sulfate sulfotransferase [Candidatus Delongbacteria bacterium]